MGQILIIEVIGYFGIIGLEIYWQIHGIRNEQRFALLQVATLTLIMITAGLNAYLSSPNPYPFGLLALSIGTLAFMIIGYPITRWIYRQFFPPK
jgi:hypothetical protein